ncbi:hypothetical protein CBL_13353 [Carabus blaptoides fortunei]
MIQIVGGSLGVVASLPILSQTSKKCIQYRIATIVILSKSTSTAQRKIYSWKGHGLKDKITSQLRLYSYRRNEIMLTAAEFRHQI